MVALSQEWSRDYLRCISVVVDGSMVGTEVIQHRSPGPLSLCVCIWLGMTSQNGRDYVATISGHLGLHTRDWVHIDISTQRSS